MSSNPPPKGGGVVVLYENVRISITDGRVDVTITRPDGSESGTIISQETGEVVGGSNKPA